MLLSLPLERTCAGQAFSNARQSYLLYELLCCRLGYLGLSMLLSVLLSVLRGAAPCCAVVFGAVL